MTYFDRQITIEYKGDADLVTAADRASEKLIVGKLRQLWPTHEIVGEEGTRDNTGTSDFRWYIDPLDGTTNFAHGYPVFCVSIGLEYRNELIVGVLYDPTRDELFAAAKGNGATLKTSHPRFQDAQDQGIDSRDRVPEPQAPQESEYPLLPPDHLAIAWHPSRWLGCARSCVCRMRTLRRLLGVQSQPLGHFSGRSDRSRSRRSGHEVRWQRFQYR